MKSFTLSFAVCAVLAAADAWAVSIAWTPVGNPGNSTDPADGDSATPGIQNFGAVAYNYNIGTYDVTNSQYVEFLNAKDPTGANTLGLWNSQMGSTQFGGISRSSGNANGNKYSVISGDGNHPVNLVTWYDAIRFANWMNNGQGDGDTESGAYTLLGGTPTPSNGLSITRNAGATVFLPSENEWYKAAYYNPVTNSYFQYPTGSNSFPIGSSPTALPNHANFLPGGPGNPTDVGAYTGTMSPYGAFEMGGNVLQFNGSLLFGSFRGARGGTWFDGAITMQPSSMRDFDDPSLGQPSAGFRLAEIPEPSSLVLAALGFIGIAWRLRRR